MGWEGATAVSALSADASDDELGGRSARGLLLIRSSKAKTLFFTLRAFQAQSETPVVASVGIGFIWGLRDSFLGARPRFARGFVVPGRDFRRRNSEGWRFPGRDEPPESFRGRRLGMFPTGVTFGSDL